MGQTIRLSRRAQLAATALLAAASMSLAALPVHAADTKDAKAKAMPHPVMMMKKVDPVAVANLRVLLNNLYRQHVHLASNAVRRGFDGAADFAAAAGALDKNSVALSKAIGSIYGDAGAKRFLEIWRSHIGFFVDYTLAAKKGDKAGMDKAVQNLGGYQEGIADFLSKANPNLPYDVVKAKVGEHIVHLKEAVDAYGAGKYEESYTDEIAAADHISGIADAVAGAIVKQFPEKFGGEKVMEKKEMKMEMKEMKKDEKKATKAAEPLKASVSIGDFSFSPAQLTVKKGTTVTWTNTQQNVKHTVTGDDGLDAPLLAAGESYSHTFNTVGTFNYHCSPHPFMKASVVVTE